MYKLNVILIVLLFFSCNSRSSFETRRAGFDYKRIPLVKPYELMQLNGFEEWSVKLKKTPSSLPNVTESIVVDSLVILHTGKSIFDGERRQEVWFVIIPSKHVEEGFTSHNSYVKFLQREGITPPPKLLKVKYIDDWFDTHYPIDWVALNDRR